MTFDEVRAKLSGVTVPMKNAADILGVCLPTAYKAAKDGELPSFRLANKIVVPTAPLRRMLHLDDQGPPEQQSVAQPRVS